MGTTTQTLLSFEEFERLPDTAGQRELLKGELIELPPPEFRHTAIAHRIYKRLDVALNEAHVRGEAAELGVPYIEMGYKLSGDSFSVALAAGEPEKYIEGSPAIAVEVISPSNTVEEMDLKTKLYFDNGALEVWLIHRKARFITVHVLGQTREIGGNDTLTTTVLPGFQFHVREILGR